MKRVEPATLLAVLLAAGFLTCSVRGDGVAAGASSSQGIVVPEGADPVALPDDGKAGRVSIPARADGELVIRGRAGTDPAGFRIHLVQTGGERTAWSVAAESTIFQMGDQGSWGEIRDPKKVTLPDACVALPAWAPHPAHHLRGFIRPNPRFYDLAGQERLCKQWETLPTASSHLFEARLACRGKQVEFWFDGRYVLTFPYRTAATASPPSRNSSQNQRIEHVPFSDGLSMIELEFPAGGVERVWWERPRADDKRFLPVPLEFYARPGSLKAGRLSLPPGRQVLNGIPLRVVPAERSVDVGLSRCLSRSARLDDVYFERSAFDGAPETIIFSVPRRQYIMAYVLCAVENDPKKAPVFTARLTRYCRGGRGDAVADTVVALPRPAASSGAAAVPVGSVACTVEGGQPTDLPLYLVSIPLRIGEIQDLLADDECGMYQYGDYFDFELTGGLTKGEKEWDTVAPVEELADTAYKPDGPPSGVHVFGLTLEESPVTMICRSRHPGNIFYRSDSPTFQVHLGSALAQGGRYGLEWTYTDLDGRETSGAKSVEISAGARDTQVEIPVDPGDVGWYRASVRLRDDKGRLLVDRRTALALLPPDTRQAGYDSPYGTWWFGTYHGGTHDPKIAGPLFLRAGLRHTTLNPKYPVTEQDLAPYKLTAAYIPYLYRRFEQPQREWLAEQQEVAEEMLRKFPGCDSALIFHEDGGHPKLGGGCFPFPPELIDAKPPELTAEQEKVFREYLWDKPTAISRYYREKHPGLKLVLGNSGWSGPLCAALFRRKYPRELIDYLGVEMLGQTIIPEKPNPGTAEGAIFLKATARRLGYGDVPLTACYEWIGRPAAKLGLRRQAEWYVRDCLIALAFGFHRVNPASAYDVGDSYYHCEWGYGNAFLRRYPDLSPRPSYVATATLTQVLDRAKYLRAYPTGSLSLYALEFDTTAGRTYALWTARGERDVTIRLPADAQIVQIDLMGRERRLATKDRSLPLTVGTAPQFLRLSQPIAEILPGASRFPTEARAAQRAVLASAMADPGQWEMPDGPDPRLQRPQGDYPPFQTRGKWTLAAATDPQRGPCLELTLLPDKKIPALVGEYAYLRLKEPIDIAGLPAAFGAWVKGNSCWGSVMWEFTDAEGETWLSCGRGGWGCDMLDWPGRIAINFDGWNFLQMPPPQIVPAGQPISGYMYPEWLNGKGNARVDLPLRLSGMAVTLYRQTPYLDQIKPVADLSIRLQGLSTVPRSETP